MRTLLAAVLLCAAMSSGCGSKADKPVGELAAMAGEVGHESSGRTSTLRAVSHEPLYPRDGITVSGDGEAAILSGRTVQRLGPGTQVRVPVQGSAGWIEVIELVSGLAMFLVDGNADKSTRFEVRARGATLTVKGTLFRVDASGPDLAVDVLTGTVAVAAGGAARDVTAGNRAVVHDGAVTVTPLDPAAGASAQAEFMSFRTRTTSITGVVTTF